MRWLLALLVLVALACTGAYVVAGRGAPPQLTIEKPDRFVGQAGTLDVTAAAPNAEGAPLRTSQTARGDETAATITPNTTGTMKGSAYFKPANTTTRPAATNTLRPRPPRARTAGVRSAASVSFTVGSTGSSIPSLQQHACRCQRRAGASHSGAYLTDTRASGPSASFLSQPARLMRRIGVSGWDRAA